MYGEHNQLKEKAQSSFRYRALELKVKAQELIRCLFNFADTPTPRIIP